MMGNPCEQGSGTLKITDRFLLSDSPRITYCSQHVVFVLNYFFAICNYTKATQSHSSLMLILLNFAA